MKRVRICFNLRFSTPMGQNRGVSEVPVEPENLVKSKQRVADHGEVFTPSWMVEDMLDHPFGGDVE